MSTIFLIEKALLGYNPRPMKNFLFALSLLVFFVSSAHSKSYTLRIIETQFSHLSFPQEVSEENLNLPCQLTPKQYESLGNAALDEFQISLPLGEKIAIADTAVSQDKGEVWTTELTREFKLEKVTDDKISLSLKILKTSFPENLKDAKRESACAQSVNTNTVLSLNTPTVVAGLAKTSSTDESTFILGDIPLLGRLFRSTKETTTRTFIVAILTENAEEETPGQEQH